MDQAPRFPSLFFRQDLSSFALPFVTVVLFSQLFSAFYLYLVAALFLGAALCFIFRKDWRRSCALILAGLALGVVFTGVTFWRDKSRLARKDWEGPGRAIVLQQTDRGTLALFLPEGKALGVSVLLEEEYTPGVKLSGTLKLFADLTGEDRAAGASYKAAGTMEPTGADPILLALGSARERCLALWDNDSVGAFYQAALLGDRSGLSGSLKSAFRGDGAMHLLAVSGLHVSQILGAIYYALFFLTRDRRLTRLVMLLSLPGVVVMTGGGLPVLRAALMTGTSLAVSHFGRRPAPLTGLSLAALILAIARPWAVGTASFLLTFSCTLGIIAVAGPLTRRLDQGLSGLSVFPRRASLALAGSFFISLSAFVFTLPCQAYFFGAVQPFALLYSLFFIPLFAPCVALGLLSLPAAFFPALSFLKVPAAWYGKIFLNLIRFVANGALGTNVSLGAASGACAVLGLAVLIACFAFRIRTDRFPVVALFLMGVVFLLGAVF